MHHASMEEQLIVRTSHDLLQVEAEENLEEHA